MTLLISIILSWGFTGVSSGVGEDLKADVTHERDVSQQETENYNSSILSQQVIEWNPKKTEGIIFLCLAGSITAKRDILVKGGAIFIYSSDAESILIPLFRYDDFPTKNDKNYIEEQKWIEAWM